MFCKDYSEKGLKAIFLHVIKIGYHMAIFQKINGLVMQFGKMFYEKIEHALKLYQQLHVTYDVELVHKFRVTLRKMYAYNSLFGKEIDKAKTKECKAILKSVIKPTSLLRDLDLILLEIEELPVQADTKAFLMQEFTKLQNREKEIILAPSYQKRLEELEQYLKNSEQFLENISYIGIYAVLTDFQNRLLKKFLKINAHTSAVKLHELRKEFKMFRYALDCYNEQCQFERKEIESFFNLKKLQDLFGVIQDNHTRMELIALLQLDIGEKIALEQYFSLQSENAKQQLLVLAR